MRESHNDIHFSRTRYVQNVSHVCACVIMHLNTYPVGVWTTYMHILYVYIYVYKGRMQDVANNKKEIESTGICGVAQHRYAPAQWQHTAVSDSDICHQRNAIHKNRVDINASSKNVTFEQFPPLLFWIQNLATMVPLHATTQFKIS
jgi:hypothetical protein